MALTLQQLIDAQGSVQFGETGQAATIINPATGKREVAEIGLTAPGYDGQTQWTTFMVPASMAGEAAQLPGVGRIYGQSGPFVSTYTNDNFLESNADLLKFAAMVAGVNAVGPIIGNFLSGAGSAGGAAGSSFLDSLPGMTQAAAPIVEGGATASPLAEAVGAGSGGFGNIAGTGLDLSTPLSASLGASEYLPAAAGSGLDLATPLSASALGGTGASLASTGVGTLMPPASPNGDAGGYTPEQTQILNGGGAASGTAGGAMTLSKLLGITGDSATAIDALGRAIPGLLGAYAANQQADALTGIADRARADRAPFLAKANEWLTGGPEAYSAGPGQGALKGVLSQLSASYGNPIDQPTALGIATDAGLKNWQSAVTGFGNLGLAGEDTRAGLETNAAGADANVWNALGASAGNVINPPSTLEQLLKQMKGLGLGANVTGLG